MRFSLGDAGGYLSAVIMRCCFDEPRGPMDTLSWLVVLRILIGFSIFVQMADDYVVGSSGTVIARWCLYKPLGPADILPGLVARRVLTGFSFFTQMADCTSYGIVSIMIPKHLACAPALVTPAAT